MPDREKVITALRECEPFGLDCYKEKCPYYTDNHCMESLHDDACALLTEQEAVKPIVDHYALPLTYTTVQFIEKYYCGICNEKITRNNVYCHKCGRKVKWDERTH